MLAGTPLHGKNIFPETPAELKPVVLSWLDHMSNLAHSLLTGVALGLGMPADFFE